jgi:hypothetical protein
MRKMSGSLVAVAVMLSLAAAPALGAEEPTRAEYKAAVEPICKANTKANEDILAGVRQKVQQGKLGPAGRQFKRAATALQRTLGELRAVPKPEGDVGRLTLWLKRVGDQATLLRQIGDALIDDNRRRAETLSVRLVSGARLTNAIVVSFGFNHCRFETSKYT